MKVIPVVVGRRIPALALAAAVALLLLNPADGRHFPATEAANADAGGAAAAGAAPPPTPVTVSGTKSAILADSTPAVVVTGSTPPLVINVPAMAAAATTPTPTAKPTATPPPLGWALPISDTWDLRVLDSTSVDLNNSAIAADDATKITDMVTQLNAIYKDDKINATVPAIVRVRNKLLLYGLPSTILKIKHDLVTLDALGPQVRLGVSAIQLSGKGADLEEQVDLINKKLLAARLVIKSIDDALREITAKHVGQIPPPQKEDYRNPLDIARPNLAERFAVLKKAGMNLDSGRDISLNEALIFLAFLDNEDRSQVFDEVESHVRTQMALAEYHHILQGIPENVLKDPLANLRAIYAVPLVPEALGEHKEYFYNVFTLTQRTEWLFVRTLIADRLLGKINESQQANGFDLTQVAVDPILRISAPGLPESLGRKADIVDDYYSETADALSADIQNDVILPLTNSIKQDINERHGGSSSVALQGQTRLVVTSGLESSLKANLTSAVDVTRPAPYTLSDATDFKSAATAAISGLSGSQAFLLGALLSPQPHDFATVAPGVGIAVRPTVLPNSASARLQIAANFGVATTMPTQTSGTLEPPAMDAVQSHTMQTDVDVDGLDLVGLSSLSIDTLVRKGPFVTPVLGRIPLIGPMFQFSRGDAQIRHYSVILVNTIIVPRALDVARNITDESEWSSEPSEKASAAAIRATAIKSAVAWAMQAAENSGANPQDVAIVGELTKKAEEAEQASSSREKQAQNAQFESLVAKGEETARQFEAAKKLAPYVSQEAQAQKTKAHGSAKEAMEIAATVLKFAKNTGDPAKLNAAQNVMTAATKAEATVNTDVDDQAGIAALQAFAAETAVYNEAQARQTALTATDAARVAAVKGDPAEKTKQDDTAQASTKIADQDVTDAITAENKAVVAAMAVEQAADQASVADQAAKKLAADWGIPLTPTVATP